MAAARTCIYLVFCLKLKSNYNFSVYFDKTTGNFNSLQHEIISRTCYMLKNILHFFISNFRMISFKQTKYINYL